MIANSVRGIYYSRTSDTQAVNNNLILNESPNHVPK